MKIKPTQTAPQVIAVVPQASKIRSRAPPVKLTNRAFCTTGATFSAPADISKAHSTIALSFLYVALAITAAPLFGGHIDTEHVRDNAGTLTIKNASYAKAFFLPQGFFAEYTRAMHSNQSALEWYPQPHESEFLGFPYADQPANGACAILDLEDPSAPECIMMSGHQGSISSYGLCRNGSTFFSIMYVPILATPANVPGIVSSGNWLENSREVVVTGLEVPPTCVDRTTVEVYPDVFDLQALSGPFEMVTVGRTTQWYDIMNLPTVVRERMHYVSEKAGNGEGIVVPSSKRQSYDEAIASDVLGVTLASKLEISTPTRTANYAFIVVHRLAATMVTLPRMHFTLAVATQALFLLTYMFIITLRNGARNTYHLVTQLLRLPTFFVVSVQLVYVAYYQIIGLAFIHTNSSMDVLVLEKLIYLTGITFLLLHQLDVRAAVTLWPKMANNDAFYLWRVTWMLMSLSAIIWRLTVPNPTHYIVSARSGCGFNATECNTALMLLPQHYALLVVLLLHPFAYGFIQIVQRQQYKREYVPPDDRTASNMTTFEAYACGDPLCYYYYYITLVTRTRGDGSVRHVTCGKAVRDEGFVVLGGCNMLIRAKDLYIIVIVKCLTSRMASLFNLSVVTAKVENGKLLHLHRISFQRLYAATKEWDGRISYPDIG